MPKAQKPYRTARGTHHGMAERPQQHFETESPVTTADPRLADTLGLKAEDDYVPSAGTLASAEALTRLLEDGRPHSRAAVARYMNCRLRARLMLRSKLLRCVGRMALA